MFLPAFLLLGMLFYANSFHAYFVADDYEFADKITWREASSYFTRGFGTANEYRPFLPLTYAVDQATGGGDPFPFHVTNTLIHTGNGLLLFSLALTIGVPRLAAVFVAVAFLLNPVTHEALLWISGRPVLLGTFFTLLAVRLFLLPRSLGLAGAVLSYLLALGTYESAIALPFALAICWVLPQYRSRKRAVTLLIIAVISVVYVTLWLRLFEFQITRFPLERSMFDMAANLGRALLHSWHGSSRVLPGLGYVAVAVYFCRTRRGWRISVLFFAFFVAGYLPFFLVHGFADRFAYLSSTAALLWLAFALGDFRNRKLALCCATALVVFFGVGMKHRISVWNEAGEIAKAIPSEIRLLAPALRSGATIAIPNAPRMHKQAYVFISGLPAAMERAYRMPLTVEQDSSKPGVTRAFAWTGLHMVEVPLP